MDKQDISIEDALHVVSNHISKAMAASRKKETDTISLLKKLYSKVDGDIHDVGVKDNVPEHKLELLRAAALLYLDIN